nr:PREDICTED: putative gustatory receptor 28b [Tribolium castaneum]|eukprot:XP_015836309.1 PREDICTED: putative gustatory receptor 28b [Tribolium castaneum]
MLENRVVFLKDIVDNFNKIFGWPLIFLMIVTGVAVVDFLDDIFKNSYDYSQEHYLGIVTATLLTVLLILIPRFAIVLSCHQVYVNARDVLKVAYNLRRCSVGQEWKQMDCFIKTVVHHLPHITAADFFQIDKTMIFHMLGTVSTYLIVVVQFNANSSV